MLQIQAIDDLSSDALKEQFREARRPDYTALIRDIEQLKPTTQGFTTQLRRLKRRLEEIAEIDFFDCPLRAKAEDDLYRVGQPAATRTLARKGELLKKEYQGRVWLTRPRPGIDRVSSAWLIKRFIDSKPIFIFGNKPTAHPGAVPFDMYQAGGFGHDGEYCTFETLCARFRVSDKKVRLIGQAIHDADLEDEKFGRTEGVTVNQILRGWAKQSIPDDELLRRGIEMIEGLFHSITA